MPTFVLGTVVATAVALVLALPASAALVATTTSLQLSSSSVSLNQAVTFTATVTAASGSAPAGTVTFGYLTGGNITPLGTTGLTISGPLSSTAALTINSLTAGNYQIVASYDGSFGALSGSTSAPQSLSVAGVVIHNTTTTLTAENTTIPAGSDAKFTAHVAENDGGVIVPTGTVTFHSLKGSTESLVGQADLDANGNATLTVGGWAAGAYTVIAEYQGDLYDHGSNAQIGLIVTPTTVAAVDTTTTVTVSPTSVQTGGNVHITAQVGQNALGMLPLGGDVVNFFATKAGGSQVFIGSGTVSWIADGSNPAVGTASIDMGGWQTGVYQIEADFFGDIYDNHSVGFGSLGVTLQAPTSLTYDGDGTVAGGSSANVSFRLTDGAHQPVATEPVVITIGAQQYAATTDANGNAAVSVTLQPGSYQPSASFAGDGTYLSSTGVGALTVQPFATTLAAGTTQAGVGQVATLTATLGSGGNPVAGKLVTLSFGSVSCQGTTAADGTVSCNVTVVDPPATYTVTASFAGDSSYSASTGTGSIAVTGRAATAIADGSGATFAAGSTASLSGTLSSGGAPLAGRTVTLALGSAACTATTNAAGQATCQVTVPAATGPTTTVASFAGDAADTSSTDSKPALIFGYAPGGGSFVVGDQTATGSVTFWGAQWWKLNVLSSGDGKAADPAAFKGFAASPGTPQCGTNWSTGPGNSPPPPNGPLPAYMAVIVTDHNYKSGPVISGDTVSVVIVKTNAGYDGNPGHAGTGTVVATLCSGGTDQNATGTSGAIDCKAKGTKCESLLASPSVPSGSTVSAGQTLSILYTDDDVLQGTPTAVLGNGTSLPVTVGSASVKSPAYVDAYGGSKSTKCQSLISFQVPPGLAAGTYSILVTVHDGDGDVDQWGWSIIVA